MDVAASHASFLPPVLTFCAAAAIAIPLVRSLGQSAVLGYLAAGVAIGPAGLSLIADPETVRGVAELGIVLFLFIIGLELKMSRLVSMRRDIFGLGLVQLASAAALIGGVAVLGPGLSGLGATTFGIALGLSATAIALQTLQERGDLASSYGRRAFAILLFQDLSIVPILALLPLAAGAAGIDGAPSGGDSSGSAIALSAAIAAGALAAVVAVGRYGLNPFFRLLAASGAREVMAASALLVVLGTALLMERVGLSMAMGAFTAGVMLAESNFRHQLEADIEPFRGMLLGLFFMSVGMSIDAGLVRQHWAALALATLAVVAGKTGLVALIFRVSGSSWPDAVRGGAILAPAGEFAFVLLPLAAGLRVLGAAEAQFGLALAACTMAVGPLAARAVDGLLARRPAGPEPEPDSFDAPGRVLVIGFGRFGQTVTQVLLSQDVGTTVIDKDVESIRNAARFGFRIYYGDGTRLDVLRAAGAGEAEVICICIDDRDSALKIVELVRAEFPKARTHVRAFDRIHALALMQADAQLVVRELFESALTFGQATLEELGVDGGRVAEVVEDVRERDLARLAVQREEGPMAGTDLLRGPRVKPEPLRAPRGAPRPLSPETRGVIDRSEARPDA